MSVSDTLRRAVAGRLEYANIRGKTILCAVSGGRDSMALLHILLRLAPELGFSVSAAHYNHRLRAGADRDEELVRRRCAALGIPLVVSGGDVRAFAREQGTSIEDAARTLRYDFLNRAAAECGADLIATAHHRKDNAETLLLHLLRGSGLRGLGGIAPLRGNIIRPLLEIDREKIEDYITENSIPYGEDETNQDISYARNRLRLELLPLLEEISPGSTGRIADTAARLRADEAYLTGQSAPLIPPPDETGAVTVPWALLQTEDRAIAVRIIRGAANELGAELTARQIEAVLALGSGGRLSLGKRLRAAKEGDALRLYRAVSLPNAMPLVPGQQQWGSMTVTVRETDGIVREDLFTVILRADAKNLAIAPWDGAGRLAIPTGRRTVKRLLADRGVPGAARETCPAIFSDGKLSAVFGAGTDLSLQPEDGEKKLVITLKPMV